MFRNVVCLYNSQNEPKYAQNVVCFQSKPQYASKPQYVQNVMQVHPQYVQNVMQVNPSMFRMLCK